MDRIFFITCLLLVVMFAPLSGQNFTWEIGDTTFSSQPAQHLEIHTKLLNNITESIKLRVVRTQDVTSQGWSTSLCVGVNCAAPFVDTMQAEIAAGNLDSLILHVNTGPDPGEASFTVKVENIDNPYEQSLHTFTVNTSTTSLPQSLKNEIEHFILYSNYPNPFNPSTIIEFQITGQGMYRTRLSIYNHLGQLVEVLLDDRLSDGFYQIRWNGTGSFRQPLPSGIYFYELRVAEDVFRKKMLLLK